MAAAATTSVKLSSSFAEEARSAAGRASRSLTGQIEHWARLGQRLEASPNVRVRSVAELLSGALDMDALTHDEQEDFLDVLTAEFETPTPDVEAYFARMRAEGGIVGDDAMGRMVRLHADGSTSRLD